MSDLALVGVFGGLLRVAGAALQLAFDLLRTTFDLLTGAARRFADLALYLPGDVLRCTLDLVFIHVDLRVVGELPEATYDVDSRRGASFAALKSL